MTEEIRTPLMIANDILNFLDQVKATDEDKHTAIEIAKLLKSTGSWTKRPMTSAAVST